MGSRWGLLSLFLLAGCTSLAPRTVRFVPKFVDDPFWTGTAPKDPAKIIVTEGDLQRPHKEMGHLIVESNGTELDPSFDRLRREAAARGIDAVIKVAVSREKLGQAAAINQYGGGSIPVVRHALEGIMVVFTDDAAVSK